MAVGSHVGRIKWGFVLKDAYSYQLDKNFFYIYFELTWTWTFFHQKKNNKKQVCVLASEQWWELIQCESFKMTTEQIVNKLNAEMDKTAGTSLLHSIIYIYIYIKYYFSIVILNNLNANK